MREILTGQINGSPKLRQLKAVQKQLMIAVYMGGLKGFHGNLRLLQCLKNLTQHLFSIPHMKHHTAALSADHACSPHIACQTDQLLCGNIGCSVVGDCQL